MCQWRAELQLPVVWQTGGGGVVSPCGKARQDFAKYPLNAIYPMVLAKAA